MNIGDAAKEMMSRVRNVR